MLITQSNNERVIDLCRNDLKKIFAEVFREEIELVTKMIINPPPVTYGYKTRQQTADHLHITLPTLRAWTKTGQIKSYKIARRVLYKPEDIDSALHEQPSFARK
jgi:hypothetical protein